MFCKSILCVIILCTCILYMRYFIYLLLPAKRLVLIENLPEMTYEEACKEFPDAAQLIDYRHYEEAPG